DQREYVGNRADSEPESPKRRTSLGAVRYVVSPRAPCALPPSTPVFGAGVSGSAIIIGGRPGSGHHQCPGSRGIASPPNGRRIRQRVAGNTSVGQIPLGIRTRVSQSLRPLSFVSHSINRLISLLRTLISPRTTLAWPRNSETSLIVCGLAACPSRG